MNQQERMQMNNMTIQLKFSLKDVKLYQIGLICVHLEYCTIDISGIFYIGL